jgi:IMP dehydrogenase
MQSLDTLNMLPVWVNPDHLAATAKIILAGHHLKVLGVLDGQELVGIITAADLDDKPESTRVRELMQRPDGAIEATTPLRQLAELFWQEDLDFLPITDRGRFRGIVTPNMLLREMARSWDPLTGLSWSDSLREWGVEHLKGGHEITILFIDLDDFGNYNKKYGHIVGDRVLKRVADMIQEKIEAGQDLLVRYGGDEFAVGTLRDQQQALDLANALQSDMANLRVAGSDEPVTFCIGVQGGKRTKERENVHYAATLDNLINLASKACMAQKTDRKSGVISTEPAAAVTAIAEPEAEHEEITSETAADLAEAHVEPAAAEPVIAPEAVVEVEVQKPEPQAETIIERALRITEVVADAADANSVTQVSIDADGKIVTGVCPRKGGSVVKSVALATANAISQIRAEVKLDIREVNLTESETGVRFISVIGTSKVGEEDRPIGGVGTVGRNLYQTVAEATLQAYNNLEAERRGTG